MSFPEPFAMQEISSPSKMPAYQDMHLIKSLYTFRGVTCGVNLNLDNSWLSESSICDPFSGTVTDTYCSKQVPRSSPATRLALRLRRSSRELAYVQSYPAVFMPEFNAEIVF